MEISEIINKRNIFFILFSLIILLIFYLPFRNLLNHSLNNELYSHIILIPFVSGYFIFLNRRQISLEMDYSLKIGIVILMIGILLYVIGKQNRNTRNVGRSHI